METPATPPQSPRIRRAVESILENEALTDNLDDDAAAVLLNWGLALAKQIVAETDGLDDDAAEAAMYPRMRALRKMLRYINRWVAAPNPRGLEKIFAQAEIVYGAERHSSSAGGAPSPQPANSTKAKADVLVFLHALLRKIHG